MQLRYRVSKCAFLDLKIDFESRSSKEIPNSKNRNILSIVVPNVDISKKELLGTTEENWGMSELLRGNLEVLQEHMIIYHLRYYFYVILSVPYFYFTMNDVEIDSMWCMSFCLILY